MSHGRSVPKRLVSTGVSGTSISLAHGVGRRGVAALLREPHTRLGRRASCCRVRCEGGFVVEEPRDLARDLLERAQRRTAARLRTLATAQRVDEAERRLCGL